MLPNLTLEEITQLEVFASKLQYPLFQRGERKDWLLTNYSLLFKAAIDGQGSILDAFWYGMSQANVPRDRPDNFDDLDNWDQILWIRSNGLPVALKLLQDVRAGVQ
jgi:hypothetical protein